MALWSWIGKRALRRIEQSPSFQEHMARAERAEPFERTAMELARSRLTDEQALAELRARVPDDEVGLTTAVQHSSVGRSDYLRDREYRLLTALVDGAPVRSMDPAMAGLFQAERELGWLPLAEAVERLAEREPRLREVMRRAATTDLASLENEASGLLGVAVEDDPLLRSDISGSIVLQYLRVMSRGGRPEPLATPYFERPLVHRSTHRLGRGTTRRPEATN